jgi:hypothetical protein
MSASDVYEETGRQSATSRSSSAGRALSGNFDVDVRKVIVSVMSKSSGMDGEEETEVKKIQKGTCHSAWLRSVPWLSATSEHGLLDRATHALIQPERQSF